MVKAIFKKIDKDGNDKLSVKEIANFLNVPIGSKIIG